MGKILRLLAASGAFVSALAGVMATAGASTSAVMKTSDEAGYSATDPSAIDTFSGTLNVPTITCPSSGTVDVSSQLGLSGTSETVGFIWNVSCTSGTVSYQDAFADFCPTAGGACGPSAATNIAAGDLLKLSMTTNTAKGTTTVSISNLTEHQSASATIGGTVSASFISAVTTFSNAGGTGNITPIPTFTTIAFGALKYNGALLSTLAPTRYEMYDGSTLQVATSTINVTGGFKTIFKHV